MRKKGVRVRYAELMTLLSIFKGIVDINSNSLHKSQMPVLLLDFNSKSDLSTPLVFSFLDTFRDKYQGNKSKFCRFFDFTEYT